MLAPSCRMLDLFAGMLRLPDIRRRSGLPGRRATRRIRLLRRRTTHGVLLSLRRTLGLDDLDAAHRFRHRRIGNEPPGELIRN
jgi:hypothetical protein